MTSQRIITLVCRSDGKVAWTKRFAATEEAIAFGEEQLRQVPIHTVLEVWDTGFLKWREEV